MCFPQLNQPTHILIEIEVVGFKRPIDGIDAIGRFKGVFHASFAASKLRTGMQKNDALAGEQDAQRQPVHFSTHGIVRVGSRNIQFVAQYVVVVTLGIGYGVMWLAGIRRTRIAHAREIDLRMRQRCDHSAANGLFSACLSGYKSRILVIEYASFDPVADVVAEHSNPIE